MTSGIFVRRETEAVSLMMDPHFCAEWQSLHLQCPWATVFQDAPYLTTWYEVYSKQYEPVVVLGRDGQGALTGLFCLGLERRTGKLMPAGAPHSEYSGWIARPEHHDQYIESAMDRLAEQFPAGRVGFGFLPPRTPLEWLGPGRRWSRYCKIQTFSRPVMAVGDGSRIRESLRKKSNKAQVKRLEKLGSLVFQRIRRFEEIEPDLDEVIDFHDFRHGALYQAMPFRADPQMGPFFRSLYEVPDLLHTSVRKLDGKVISAHIGFRDRDQVRLGILAYSPFLAEHSPGRMHLYLLGLLLVDEGIAELDLTAGGDAYKERFATDHDEVHRLTVYFSVAKRLRSVTLAGARMAAKRLLGFASFTPDQVRKTIDNIKLLSGNVSTSLRRLTPAGRRKRDRVVYQLDRASIVGDLPDRPFVQRDVLADLLAYKPSSARDPSPEGFLRDALERLERGDRVFTCVEDGLLVSAVWLTRLSGSAGKNQGELVGGFPTGSVRLDGFSTQPIRRDAGLFRASIAKILADLASSGDPSPVIVLVDSADLALTRVLIEFGFDNRPRLAAETSGTSLMEVNSAVGSPRPALEFHDASTASRELDG